MEIEVYLNSYAMRMNDGNKRSGILFSQTAVPVNSIVKLKYELRHIK